MCDLYAPFVTRVHASCTAELGLTLRVHQCSLSDRWCICRRAGLLKTQALRGSVRDVTTDERAAFMFDISSAGVDQLLTWVYPSLYPVHDPSGDWGKPDAHGRCGTANASPQ